MMQKDAVGKFYECIYYNFRAAGFVRSLCRLKARKKYVKVVTCAGSGICVAVFHSD